MFENYDNYRIEKKLLAPIKIIETCEVLNADELIKEKPPVVSFETEHCAVFGGKGSFVILDFGKELCGGIRIVTRDAAHGTDVRITLGESLSEACSELGFKNSTNDHSPRDFTARLTFMSDLTFGGSGFRFARIELLSDTPALIQSIYAESRIPYFEREATVKTSDEEINKILETATYTLKLCLQNGYIWDGIKRDRLVWSGDLHQEIVSSLYLFGDNVNITNSLSFLRRSTPDSKWINNMPSYSAWWVINFCDYCLYTDNRSYFEENRDYAEFILNKLNDGISDNGDMEFSNHAFLDWPTKESEDAITGTALIIILAAQRYLKFGENNICRDIIVKLNKYITANCEYKQTRAFQILAGRRDSIDCEFLEKNGAAGFSTFMTYYILTADALSGGGNMLEIIKQYFGGMLSRGATTFWEDFDLEWLKDSGRIDVLPKDGQKDLHGDYGSFCYKGFRHSLCHGWSSGVISFVIETLFGIKYSCKNKTVEIKPHKICPDFDIKFPLSDGYLKVCYKNKNLTAEAPEGITVDLSYNL